MGLWTLVNSWCNDHRTDGAVPRDIWDEFGTTLGTAQKLVDAGFWEETKDGYQVVNWSEYNKTSIELEEKRATEAERKRRWREAKRQKEEEEKASSEASPSNVPVGQAGQSEDVPAESALSHTHTHTQRDIKNLSEPAVSDKPKNIYPDEPTRSLSTPYAQGPQRHRCTRARCPPTAPAHPEVSPSPGT